MHFIDYITSMTTRNKRERVDPRGAKSDLNIINQRHREGPVCVRAIYSGNDGP